MKNCVVIGGGIIGLCTAYYLLQEGHEVTVIDKSDMSKGASFINAGYITPSHIIPLSAPGIISKGIKWMFNPSSPFYVKPRLDWDFLQWSWAFKKSATALKVQKAIPVIKEINLLSRELYQTLKTTKDFDFHFEHKGLMMYYQTEKAGEEEWEVGKQAISEGLNVKQLSKEEIKTYEPDVDLNIKGAIYYDSDAHMTPHEFMDNMYTFLKEKGVTFYINEEVTDLKIHKKKITTVVTQKRTLQTDEVVLAAGSWSSGLAKKLDLKIPIQAGKGYRINVQRPLDIKMPGILMEAKVAVTPMNGLTRFAGTMEIGGINHDIAMNRVRTIAKASESYYEGLKIEEAEIADADCGLRPCSPDGLPYIGRVTKYENLVVASGHAMMGWSLGPSTGKLVSEIVSDKKTSMDLGPFHPERKF